MLNTPTFKRGILIIGSALSFALVAGCGKPKSVAVAPVVPKQPVEVAAIRQRDLTEMLSLVGSLAPNESAQIRAEISGQVRAVLFEEGGMVKKGQVLLKIDDAELRAQLAQAEARFHLNELSLKRSQNLTESRSMSQAEADRVRSEFAASEAEVQLLRIRLAKMELKAPFDGVVGARTISAGDYITAATIVTTLNDLSRLKIDFQVPERYTSKINRVQVLPCAYKRQRANCGRPAKFTLSPRSSSAVRVPAKLRVTSPERR